VIVDSLGAIHDALAHLYQIQYLQGHPLAASLPAAVASTARGWALHRRLSAAIERLRPPENTPDHALAWRNYRYLTLRYVHSLTVHQVAADLGITERHCRRVQKEALTELGRVLVGVDVDVLASYARQEAQTDHRFLEDELSRVGTAPEPPASLHQTVSGVIQTLAALATSAQTTLSQAVDPPRDVPVDRLSTRQILLNLLVYLIREYPGAQILVRTRSTIPVRLDIAVLLPPGEAARKGDPSGHDDHIAIAQRLAELRGGVVRFASARQGLVLTVVLPTSRRLIVLLVDDNPDALRLYRRYLSGHNYDVLETTAVEEAITMAQADRPDAIVLDVLMPRQDGWETLQRLANHQATRHIPVIICSILHERELAFSLGAAGFLPKPVTQAALLEALDRCVPEGPRLVSAGGLA
jgi:CheY-like chemotaxis protein